MPDENSKEIDTSQDIEDLKRYILSAENSLEAAKKSLANITGETISKVNKSSLMTGKLEGLSVTPDGKIIEGIFDGENMIGPDEKIFPVPANYASKSKLIEGDKLKLTVAEDGTFIYKQIGPAPRKSIIGTLNFSDNSYHVLAEGKSYDILYASVTYYKAKAGDRVTIVVPDSLDSRWASLDNVIHNVKTESEPEENILDDEPKLTQQIDNINPTPPLAQPAIEPVLDTKVPEVTEEPTPENKPLPEPPTHQELPNTPVPQENTPEQVLETQPASELDI